MAVVNPLLKSQLFLRVGSNASLACSPSVLHFGAYDAGSIHRQTLRVINKGPAPVRYHILTPATPFFRATCTGKKGALSPGCVDEIVVEFEPNEYRYYYDTVSLV
jgi:hypothetical protein